MPSWSASSAAVDGNAMSGVIVATISRSTVAASTPAISSARMQAGSAMSVIASSGLAIRRSRMPVRETTHSSVVSMNSRRSSFVMIRSGTWQPRPVIVTRRPALPIIRRPPRRSRCLAPPAARRRSPSRGPCRPARARSRSRTRAAASRPGRTIRLKRTSSMPANNASLPVVLGLREHRNRPALGQRLDHLHPRHDRVAGKVPGAVGFGHGLPRHHAHAGHELEHLVDAAASGRGAE